MDLSLRGRKALITGGSKGIGAAVAEALAEEGCELHLAARGLDQLQAHATRLRDAHGVTVSVHEADLGRTQDVTALAAAVGDVDILVNNAGSIAGGPLHAVDESTWRHGWDLKVYGTIDLTRPVYARMKARGGGVIINVIGASGERADTDMIAMGSGSAALMAFTRTLGGRSLEDNIRVLGINPGPVATERIIDLMRSMAVSRLGDAGRYPELMQRFPLGRAARPREIADVVAFLASDRSAYTTGVIVTVDGGMCAKATI